MGGGYKDASGTSLATAVVSGVAALIVANHPEFTREQIKERLINSADDLGNPGKDIYFGYGRVNAFNSLDPVTTSSSTTTTSITQGPCATVKIYGEDSDEVAILRYLRDNLLIRTPEGREIIRLYHRWNPLIVQAMKSDEAFIQQLKESKKE